MVHKEPVSGNTLAPFQGVQFWPISCDANGFRRRNAPAQVLPWFEPCHLWKPWKSTTRTFNRRYANDQDWTRRCRLPGHDPLPQSVTHRTPGRRDRPVSALPVPHHSGTYRSAAKGMAAALAWARGRASPSPPTMNTYGDCVSPCSPASLSPCASTARTAFSAVDAGTTRSTGRIIRRWPPGCWPLPWPGAKTSLNFYQFCGIIK